MWCIPKVTSEFKRRMFDVLKVYERPYDPLYPVVCIDEKSKQLLQDTRAAISTHAGKPAKQDYEYIRRGVVNLFVVLEPKGKIRYVKVTNHRRKIDFVRLVKKLVTKNYKNARKIVLISDNLNTHNKKALIEVLGEKEGRKIAGRIQWHYTPKHASWLNQAEIEIHALSTQCLDRRIPTFQDMQHEVAVWVQYRNRKQVTINWQFTREKAKEKFKLT